MGIKLILLLITVTGLASCNEIKLDFGGGFCPEDNKDCKTIRFSSLEDLEEQLMNDKNIYNYFEKQLLSGNADKIQTTISVEKEDDASHIPNEETTTASTKSITRTSASPTVTGHADAPRSKSGPDLLSSGWTKASNNFWYKRFPSAGSYLQARFGCSVLDARLASTGMRNNMVKRHVMSDQNFTKYTTRFTWVGLNENTSTNTWRWSDGVISTSNNTGWKEGEPNNDDPTGEDCGALDADHKWMFSDYTCGSGCPFLCEKILAEDLEADGWNILGNGHWYKLFHETVNYTIAANNCKAVGGRLASSGNHVTFTAVIGTFSEKLGIDQNSKNWIGLDDIDQDKEWTWSDGHHLFAGSPPATPATAYCMMLEWISLARADCHEKKNYICELVA